MTLLSLKQARRRPNRTFPNSHYTPHAFLLQIKANNCPFPWQDRVHTAGTAERVTGVTVGLMPLDTMTSSALLRPNLLLLLMMMMMIVAMTNMLRKS